MGRYARLVAGLFTTVGAYYGLVLFDYYFGPKDMSCTGLFGVRTSCASNDLFFAYALLFDPIVLFILWLVIATGIVSLFTSKR